MIIDYTSEFKQHLKHLRRRYRSIQQDLEALLVHFKDGQVTGDQMLGMGHSVFKVRVKNSDAQKGKSGGYRVIYYLKGQDRVTLLAMYSKSDQSTISTEVVRRILGHYLNE